MVLTAITERINKRYDLSQSLYQFFSASAEKFL